VQHRPIDVKTSNFLLLHRFLAVLFFPYKSTTLHVINGLANNLINSLCAEPNIPERTACDACANFLRSETFLFRVSDLRVARHACQQFCPQKMLTTAQSGQGKWAAQKTRTENKSSKIRGLEAMRGLAHNLFHRICAEPRRAGARAVHTCRTTAKTLHCASGLSTRSKFCSPSSKLPAGRSGCC
jgi:hypothetical protein